MSNNTAYPRLFLFCIGGTGSRVLKALTFLLASGIKIKARQVIPIIIDPDRTNGDMIRTIEILKDYREIREKTSEGKKHFFQTSIDTLASLEAEMEQLSGEDDSLASQFRFGIDGTSDGMFKDFISYNSMSHANQTLVKALFSEDNLKAELNVGFKGNPHMGSVALNRFMESDEIRFFSSRFSQRDRVFIVSSIFGGTGAAGFPLLVKNLRQPPESLNNRERIRNAPIGAVSIAPYFGVKANDDSEINKSTFISKTKAAYKYYAKNLSGNGSLNALYYLADEVTTDYENHEGAEEQKNKAHLIEYLAAESIIDFMEKDEEAYQTQNSSAVNPLHYHYGLNGNVDKVTFKNLGQNTHERVFKPMVQFSYAVYFWLNCLGNEVREQTHPWVKSGNTPISEGFLQSTFYSKLLSFSQKYREWLWEMATNERALHLFNMSIDAKNMHTLIEDYEQKKTGFISKKSNWDIHEFNNLLNKTFKQVESKGLKLEDKLFVLFYQATNEIFNNRVQH